MSDRAPAPADEAPQTGGEGSSPSEAARPAPPPPAPATTTDLGRFPEKSETSEITTFLAGDVPAQADRPGSGALRPTPLPVPSVGGPSDLPVGIDPQIEIERRLSAGGMGEVFLARQKHLGRYVAVKRIRDLGAEIATKERFIHEAKAQSRLQHPGIAQVHDLREAQGELYLIMEYVEGRTLEEILAKDGKFSPDQVASLGVQLTEALEAAAHEGYIHRDLKPGNVMLTTAGKIKIIDFGLALLIRNLKQTRLTEKGEILGTPAFMSPEQLNQEEKLDVRSDIWSLGVLLYTLATAETPFTGKDFVCTVKNVMMADPVPLTTLEPGFPPGLWEAIARALRKDRNERWQDYASFREALLSGKGRAGDGAPPDPVVTERGSEYVSSGGPRRLGRGVSALVFGTLVALLGILAVRYLPLVQKSPPPGTTAGREDTSHVPASPPAKVEPERPKAPPPSPELSPAPSSAVKPEENPLLPPPGPAAKPVALREKLLGYAATEEEVAFVREVLDLFSQHRPELQAKEFAPLEADLDALERDRLGLRKDSRPAPEKEYRAAQIRSACRMVKVAKGALLARLEELKRSKEAVTLLLSDGTSKTGVVEGFEGGNVSFAVRAGGQEKLPLGSILPESLKAQGAPASAFLALLALSGRMEHSFPEILELSASRDDFLFWIPIAIRLARHEVEATAKVVAAEKKGSVSSQAARPVDPRAARVGSLAEMLANAKDGILRLFGHIQPDFDIVEREGQALRLLLDGQHAQVLALGPATAAFPVAAEILVGRFQAELEEAHDELHARTGWHGYGWRLFPPERSLKEQQKFWDLDPEGNGTLLQANEIERRVAMGKGAMRAPEGVLAKVVYEPKDDTKPEPSSHWRFLLRSREGALSYLRFDRDSCALYRTRLEPGMADEVVAKASLPAASKPDGERLLALLPIDGALHVLVDGRHVLALPAADAAIPMQLSFSVAQGKLWIQSVKVKKSPEGEDGNR